MNNIAVLIPCYNESKTIAKVVADFKRVLPQAKIIVCDNNSSDGTDEIARAAGATVIYEYKQGKGNAVRKMFREIDADCYIMTDGEDTYPAEYASQMAVDMDHLLLDVCLSLCLQGWCFWKNGRISVGANKLMK